MSLTKATYSMIDGAPLNILDFGAVGDGVTDDTAALIAVLAESNNSIYFPEGTYLVTGTANGYDISNKSLIGAGYGVSRIKMAGANTAVTLFRGSATDPNTPFGQGGGGCFLMNLTLEGNWDGTTGTTTIVPPTGHGDGVCGIQSASYSFSDGALLKFFSATGISVRNCGFYNSYGHAILSKNIAYSSITDSWFSQNRGSGIWMPSESTNVCCTSTRIINNQLTTQRGTAGAIHMQYASGCAIYGNLFENQPYGVYMNQVVDINLGGNYFEAHYYDDQYANTACWGIVDTGSYLYEGNTFPTNTRGSYQYARKGGFFVNTENVSAGLKDPSWINGWYLQNYYIGYGVDPAHMYQYRLESSNNGAGSLGLYKNFRVENNNTDAGASEIRFKTNLFNDSRSAITFVTNNGTTLGERWSVYYDGTLLPAVDNSYSLGNGTYRASVIYAGTGTINTSDANEKQDIEDLSDAEKRVAVKIKSLIKKFRFKDAVAQKGDKARIHVGVIAQEVKFAFESEGLDATNYGMFCSDELDDGSIRLGVRYDELLAFVLSAI